LPSASHWCFWARTNSPGLTLEGPRREKPKESKIEFTFSIRTTQPGFGVSLAPRVPRVIPRSQPFIPWLTLARTFPHIRMSVSRTTITPQSCSDLDGAQRVTELLDPGELPRNSIYNLRCLPRGTLTERFDLSIFFLMGFFAFLQGVFEKMGGKTWFFGGEFVVESW
jgi:hypothetical protein